MLVPGGKKAGNLKQCFSSRLGTEIMVFCAATNCTNRSKSKVSTFKFLAHPKIQEEWLTNLKREPFQPTKHSRLRENHFTEDSFDESYAIKLSQGLKPRKPQLTAANALPPSVHWYTVSTNTPILRV